MMRGRRRPARFGPIQVVPDGATLVIQAYGELDAEEVEAIGRAVSGPQTVVFFIHGKAVVQR